MPGATELIGAAMAPAKAASAMPHGENEREQHGNVDAQGRGHLTVAGAGANHHADASFVNDPVMTSATIKQIAVTNSR